MDSDKKREPLMLNDDEGVFYVEGVEVESYSEDSKEFSLVGKIGPKELRILADFMDRPENVGTAEILSIKHRILR